MATLTKDQSLWSKFYNATKETIESAFESSDKKELRKKFEAAFDQRDKEATEAEVANTRMLENIKTYSISKWLENKGVIEEANKQKQWLRDHHLEMFGTAIREDV